MSRKSKKRWKEKQEGLLGFDYESDWGISLGHLCKHRPKIITKVDGLVLWGAAKPDIDESDLASIDLVVNCTNIGLLSQRRSVIPHFPDKYAHLKNHFMGPQVDEIILNWNDQSSYPAKLSFWQDLHKSSKANGCRDVLFCCIGGHGRTGTALAAMIVANSPYPSAKHAMDRVRQKLCKECIETYSQEAYLYDLEEEKTGKSATRVFTSKQLVISSSTTTATNTDSSATEFCSTCSHTKGLHRLNNTSPYAHGVCMVTTCNCKCYTDRKPIKFGGTDGRKICYCQHSRWSHSDLNDKRCLVSGCQCEMFYELITTTGEKTEDTNATVSEGEERILL